MFYEAETTYSSFLKFFCVHHQLHMVFPSVNPMTDHQKDTKKPTKTMTKTLGFCVEYHRVVLGLWSTIPCGWW